MEICSQFTDLNIKINLYHSIYIFQKIRAANWQPLLLVFNIIIEQ